MQTETTPTEREIRVALGIIKETNKASATMLQRVLCIGFSLAAKIMDELEKRGFVGPQEGAKAREIHHENISNYFHDCDI